MPGTLGTQENGQRRDIFGLAQSGKAVEYKDLPEADYKAALIGVGLPAVIADLLANSDVGASAGGLFDDGRQLSRLIGRPTTPLASSVGVAMQG